MIDLSIIIVNYNVKPFLEQSLTSIRKALCGIESEIIVVDNGSGDGSALFVRQTFPDVRLIENEENLGFAKANNQALRESHGRIVCLINPDTLVREDTFRICLSYLDGHADTGMVGCKVLNTDGTLQLSCRRSFPTPWVAFTRVVGLSRIFPKSRLFGRYNLTFMDPDEATEVEAISGSFMMVKASVIDQVGLLDDRFFLYGEDLDWCYRIHQAGWKIMYLPDTQIIHYKGQSTREASFDRLMLFYGAMLLFVKKHFSRGRSFLPRWFLFLGICIRGAFSFISRLAKRLLLPIIDLGFIQLALVFALTFRFGHLRHWTAYRPVNIVYSAVWLISLFAMGLYKKGIYSSTKAVGGVGLGLVFNTSLTFFFPQYAFSRQVVLTEGLLNALFLSGWRLLVRLASHIQHVPFVGTIGKTLLRRRALIVGAGEAGRQLLNRLRNRLDTGFEVVGFLGLDESDLILSVEGGIPVLGTLKDLERIASTHRIHVVIFSPEAASYERILSTVATQTKLGLDFKLVPSDLDFVIGKASIDSLKDLPFVDLEYRFFSGPNRFLKRIEDILGACILLPVALPFYLYMKLNPAYRFSRDRISNGSDKGLEIVVPFKDGRQIIGWLRTVTLLLPVLRGRMSFVGAETVPFTVSRNPAYKPGLTGLVQIQGGEGLDSVERERLDMFYLKNYSPLLDLEILMRTVFRR